MNSKFPCIGCPIKEHCDDECAPYLNYFRRLIRSYAKYGNRSRLMKAARKQFPVQKIQKMTNGIDRFFNIGITHSKSGNWYSINRYGTVVNKGSKDDSPFGLSAC